ncbi:MAG: hypothetical protein AAGI88_24545 [Pseudomonadota bacterium]
MDYLFFDVRSLVVLLVYRAVAEHFVSDLVDPYLAVYPDLNA